MNCKANTVRFSEFFDLKGNSFHLCDEQILEIGQIPSPERESKFKARRTVRSKVLKSFGSDGKQEWWTRSELRQILGTQSTPMPEPTFKRRLELLELCPEVDRRLYKRRFSDFSRWCLVEIERIYQEFDRNTEQTIEYLENTGLETANYFEEKQ